MDIFERIFESSPDALILVNASGGIVRANEQAAKAFGYERSAFMGLTVEALVPERFAESHAAHRAEFCSTSKARAMGAMTRPLYGRRRDGTEFEVDVMLSPFDTEEGRLVLCVVRDQTERVAAVKKLASNVAHEFNNLLTVIQGSTDLLVGALPAEVGAEDRALLGAIRSATERATRLTRQLLLASRIRPPTPENVAAVADAGEAEASDDAPATVLVVDDEVPVRRVTARILAHRGYIVREAASGAEAVTLLENDDTIDLLLTDVVMPGMSGGQLAATVRKRWPHLPIVFMSGYHDDALVRKTGDDGVPLLQKPFSGDALCRAIASRLDVASKA